MVLRWFTFEILANRCPIRQEPSSFTHSLQICFIGLIGLISQLFWDWATNRDPTFLYKYPTQCKRLRITTMVNLPWAMAIRALYFILFFYLFREFYFSLT